jgi:hypothetical protein
MPADDEYQQMRDVWHDHNSRQEFEHTLIDRKTTWLLTTQTILFAAYGVTFSSEGTPQGREVFRIVVGCSGAALAALGYYGVARLVKSKELSWQDYRAFFKTSLQLPGPLEGKELKWGVRTDNTRHSLYPDRLFPVVFIIAWSILVVSELLA